MLFTSLTLQCFYCEHHTIIQGPGRPFVILYAVAKSPELSIRDGD
jgi:hypothetical protein